MSSLRHISQRTTDPRLNGYLDSARDCILDVGWRRTTLTEVAKELGVRVCPIYGDAFDAEVRSYARLMRANADSLKECLS